jgi:coiled-coil domain-containing protein 12
MSLSAKQEERKKRLQQLKKVAVQNDGKRHREDDQVINFKSYKPTSVELVDFQKDMPLIGEEALRANVDTVETRVLEINKQVVEENSKAGQELDLENLAPRKPNWDLKRDLEKKMKRLDKLTAIAMSEIIRERLIASHELDLEAADQDIQANINNELDQ